MRTLLEDIPAILRKLGALAAAASTLYLAGMTPAAAQDAAAEPLACAQIENDAERLACYDRAQRTPAEASPESRADAAPAAPTRTEAPARSARSETEPQSTAVVIVSVRQRRGLNTLFTTDEGHVWAQLGLEQDYFPPPPFDAVIRPGSLGSFFLVPAQGTAVRVRRRE